MRCSSCHSARKLFFSVFKFCSTLQGVIVVLGVLYQTPRDWIYIHMETEKARIATECEQQEDGGDLQM